MTDPEEIPVDSVQGTTRVVTISMVVTGMDVAIAPADVTVLAQVTIAGLELTCAAQIPWKYAWAAGISLLSPWAERHS